MLVEVEISFIDFLLSIAWKVSKYGVFSGPNTGKYGPEKSSYLNTFHVVEVSGVTISHDALSIGLNMD